MGGTAPWPFRSDGTGAPPALLAAAPPSVAKEAFKASNKMTANNNKLLTWIVSI